MRLPLRDALRLISILWTNKKSIFDHLGFIEDFREEMKKKPQIPQILLFDPCKSVESGVIFLSKRIIPQNASMNLIF